MRRATLAVLLGALLGAGYAEAGEPGDPVPAAAPPLIDPDCFPEWAEQADPALLEEPDGVCPPDSPKPPGVEAKPQVEGETEPEPDTEPGPPQAADPPPSEPSQAPAAPTGSAPAPPSSSPQEPGSPKREGKRRRPAKDRAPVRPRRETAERRSPARERREPVQKREAPSRRRIQRVRRIAKQAPAPHFPVSAHGDTLPDPIPPARRLDRRFAKRLERVSGRAGVRWELMLAVIRARGDVDTNPATPRELRRLARRLVKLGARKHPRRAVRRLAKRRPAERRRPFVQRVVALAHYNRAARLAGLVKGLRATRKRLARRVLDHRRLAIYAGGREDISSGFTDVRVLVLLLYLSSRSSEVTVTSLTSGHGFLTASGNVSLHSHGRAVDIAAIGGRPILGNQEPGGVTERTLRQILLLPKRLQPTELISLFDLGGPAFALADHADHIHAGY